MVLCVPNRIDILSPMIRYFYLISDTNEQIPAVCFLKFRVPFFFNLRQTLKLHGDLVAFGVWLGELTNCSVVD